MHFHSNFHDLGMTWKPYSYDCIQMQVNFLSQIRLSNRGDGPKVAKRLLDVYFALFKVLIKFYIYFVC